MNKPHRAPALALALLGASACSDRAVERTQEVSEDVRREIEVEAKRGAEQAREQLEQVDAKVGEQIDAAREHLDVVSERIGEAGDRLQQASRESLHEAKQGLDRWLGEQRERIDDTLGYEPIEGAAEAIECRDDHCTLTAAFIDRLADSPHVLAREAIVVPTKGVSDKGLRLSKVEPGSVPALLGLRDGDILVSLNGTNLASLEAPRALERALAGKDDAELVYERAGERRTLKLSRVGPG